MVQEPNQALVSSLVKTASHHNPPLTILSDSEVISLLSDLSRDDVLSMQQALRSSLHEYSTAKQDNPACQKNQQERMVCTAWSELLSGSNKDLLGDVKQRLLATLEAAPCACSCSGCAIALNCLERHKVVSFTKNEQVVEHRNGTTTLIMPAQNRHGMSVKVVTLAAPSGAQATIESEEEAAEEYEMEAKKCPQGSLTLMKPDGVAFGFVNAEELTAFRTALASSLLMSRRSKVHTITVFGGGKQAYWHVRLALMLHGRTIHHVHIHSHRFSDALKEFYRGFVGFDVHTKEREGWTNCKFDMKTPGHHEYTRMAKADVRSADIIICATPSEEPLFDEKILTNPSGRLKGRLIIAVGSFKASMIELPPGIIRQAVKQHGNGHHFRKRAQEGSCVLVDTTKALTQTGELIQAGLKENHVVEIGEILMLDEQFAHEQEDDYAIDDTPSTPTSRPSIDATFSSLSLDGKSSMASAMSDSTNRSGNNSRSNSASSRSGSISEWKTNLTFLKRHHDLNDTHERKQSKDEREMGEWLARGNVIYKSVGIGLMDLVVGMEVVALAKQKGVGTIVDGF